MHKSFLLFLLSCNVLMLQAQQQIRPLEALINKEDPGWPLVQQWIDHAKNKVEILPVDTNSAKEVLWQSQVTTRSPMGAIVYMTGGLLIDHGWIRILGSGCPQLPRSLTGWNKGKTFMNVGERPGYLLIADDVIGGFYLLNGGGLGPDVGKVYYFAPDNLKYEPLDLTYTQFLMFCFNNDLQDFYLDYRWTSWKEDIAKINGDQVFNFYPPLWTKEGKNMTTVARKAVPIEEEYRLHLQFRKQLGLE